VTGSLDVTTDQNNCEMKETATLERAESQFGLNWSVRL
jgi:hypothetical protein